MYLEIIGGIAGISIGADIYHIPTGRHIREDERSVFIRQSTSAAHQLHRCPRNDTVIPTPHRTCNRSAALRSAGQSSERDKRQNNRQKVHCKTLSMSLFANRAP